MVEKLLEYSSWANMIRRCTSPKASKWKYYGGRGIRVCERWRNSFTAFLSDVGPRPSREYQIERINNDGNYEPGNCRWATHKEQMRNRRSWAGKATKCRNGHMLGPNDRDSHGTCKTCRANWYKKARDAGYYRDKMREYDARKKALLAK